MELTNIYLMRDDHTRLYKIGRSVDPFTRERTLLSQAPATQLLCFWSKCPPSKESQLHARFHSTRRRGEWFELGDDLVADLLREMFQHRRKDVHADMWKFKRMVAEDEFHYSALVYTRMRECAYSLVDGTFTRESGLIHREMEWANDGGDIDALEHTHCTTCRIFADPHRWRVEKEGQYQPGGNRMTCGTILKWAK